jgi:hypothetical protein
MTQTMPFQTLLGRFFEIATQICDEILAFKPDVIIVLMHSGWLPFYAVMELWNRTQKAPLPPIVRVNLGREKLKRFNELEGSSNVTSSFVGELESSDVIAFFLAWLYDQANWQEDLRSRIQEAIGNEISPRILIVDESVFEGTTWLLTLGLLNLICPKADVGFYSAEIEWKFRFFDAWAEAYHPELLQTDLFPPKDQQSPLVPAREAAILMVAGTEDADPESLDWKTIGVSSSKMELLSKYLPAGTWLELPRFAEQTVRNEIARRAGEYVPNTNVLKVPGKHLQPGWLVLREIHRRGPITTQGIAKRLGWSATKARYHLEQQVNRGYLVVQRNGRGNQYVLSPMTDPSYWQKEHFFDTYCVIPGKLMAGELPGYDLEVEEELLMSRLRWLLDQGVTAFINLAYTVPGPPETYENRLRDLAIEYGKDIKYTAIPTPTWQLPRRKTIQSALNRIDEALDQGHTIYVHDTNRNVTELVLGCYFVNHGMSGPEALKELDRIRQGSHEGWRRAPSRERARRLVRKWERPRE